MYGGRVGLVTTALIAAALIWAFLGTDQFRPPVVDATREVPREASPDPSPVFAPPKGPSQPPNTTVPSTRQSALAPVPSVFTSPNRPSHPPKGLSPEQWTDPSLLRRGPYHTQCGNRSLRIGIAVTAIRDNSSSVGAGHIPNEMYRDSFVNKLTYARRQGYDLLWETELPKTMRLPTLHWFKVYLAMRWLEEYDWLLVVDADTLIMDFGARIESFIPCDADLVVAMEDHSRVLNTGVLLVRHSPHSKWFLQSLLRTPPQYWRPPMYEQGAFNYLYFTQPDVKRVIKVTSQRPLNTFPAQWCWDGGVRYQPSDFIVHFAAFRHCVRAFGPRFLGYWGEHVQQSVAANHITSSEQQWALEQHRRSSNGFWFRRAATRL